MRRTAAREDFCRRGLRRSRHAGDFLESAAVGFPVLVITVEVKQLTGPLGVDVTSPDRHHAARVPVRKWLEQNRVQNAEYRRVRADPERQGEDHNARETGRTPENPKSIIQILHQYLVLC